MLKNRPVGIIGAAAFAVVAALGAPAAHAAATRVQTDQFSGTASARALDLQVLGRHLTLGVATADSSADVVGNRLDLNASGVGTLLSPKTASSAATGAGDKPARGGRACYQPPLADLLAGAGLPPLIFGEAACGAATTKGDVSSFEASGTGEVATLRLNTTQVLKPVIDALQPVLRPVEATPVGQLLQSTDPAAQQAITALNGAFGSLLGQNTVVLPAMEPAQTVKDLADRIAGTDLIRVDIGDAIATNTATAARFTSQATAKAGAVEVLPAFRGPGLPPLLKISLGESAASVLYDRNTTTGAGSATNTLVRIESELLPAVALGQVGTPGVTPFAALATQLGIKSGPGYVELAPGQNVTLFCDGPVSALCTEISVGQPTQTRLPDGGLRVESAAVTIHLFKGLDNLVPGRKLGTLLGDADLEQLLAPLNGTSGLNPGEKSDIPGIRLALAHTLAEASGTRVAGPSDERPRTATGPATPPPPEAPQALPRTGGLPLPPVTIPALLAAGAGLRTLARRRPS